VQANLKETKAPEKECAICTAWETVNRGGVEPGAAEKRNGGFTQRAWCRRKEGDWWLIRDGTKTPENVITFGERGLDRARSLRKDQLQVKNKEAVTGAVRRSTCRGAVGGLSLKTQQRRGLERFDLMWQKGGSTKDGVFRPRVRVRFFFVW